MILKNDFFSKKAQNSNFRKVKISNMLLNSIKSIHKLDNINSMIDPLAKIQKKEDERFSILKGKKLKEDKRLSKPVKLKELKIMTPNESSKNQHRNTENIKLKKSNKLVHKKSDSSFSNKDENILSSIENLNNENKWIADINSDSKSVKSNKSKISAGDDLQKKMEETKTLAKDKKIAKHLQHFLSLKEKEISKKRKILNLNLTQECLYL